MEGPVQNDREQQTEHLSSFQQLKPLCLQFLATLESQNKIDVARWKEKIKESLAAIEDKIFHLPTVGVVLCFEYVSFPLIMALRQLSNKEKNLGDTTVYIARTLFALLQQSTVELTASQTPPWTPDQAISIIQQLCDTILPTISSASEELKLITFKILLLIFDKEPSSTSSFSRIRKVTEEITTQNIFDKMNSKMQGRQLLGSF
jgi:hypothetical protein